MLKIQNLKQGDIISVNDGGTMRIGTVVNISRDENQALVDNGIQEFWYSQEDMYSLPLDENQLMKFGFEKEEVDGAIKYKKDSFRLVTPKNGNFTVIEMWWREDKRHFEFPLGVHDLQNLYLEMTKVPLDLP